MPAKLEPISKLNYAWPKGENDWNLGMDENLRRIGVLLQNGVESHTDQVPASPTAGKLYIVPPSATGAWAGKSGQIATWEPSAWFFVEPRDGMIMYNVNTKDILVYIGASWVSVVATDPTYVAFKAAYDAFVTSVLQWRNHTYISTQELVDLRTPKWYFDTYGLCTKHEFVLGSLIDSTMSAAYGTLQTFISYSTNFQNGYIRQVFYQNGRLCLRQSSSDEAWSAWTEFENTTTNTIKDTRNDNQPPEWYWANYPQRTVTEFKGLVMGLTEWSTLTTVVPNNTYASRHIKQVARTSSGKEFTRTSLTATQWSNWIEADVAGKIGGRNLLIGSNLNLSTPVTGGWMSSIAKTKDGALTGYTGALVLEAEFYLPTAAPDGITVWLQIGGSGMSIANIIPTTAIPTGTKGLWRINGVLNVANELTSPLMSVSLRVAGTPYTGMVLQTLTLQRGSKPTDWGYAAEDFGAAAFYPVTVSDTDLVSGRLIKTGDYGIGSVAPKVLVPASWDGYKVSGFYNATSVNAQASQYSYGLRILRSAVSYVDLLLPYGVGINPFTIYLSSNYQGTRYEQHVYSSRNPIVANTADAATAGKLVTVSSTGEFKSKGFTVDANGFYKSASPIIRLFADRVELNGDAAHQDITFEKVAVGHYLIKGSSGFATDGWWLNVPVDSNGNKIVASTHETLDDGTLSIKTYKRKFDIETASIVPDLDNPIDIPTNSLGESRWIDIRLIEIDLPSVEDYIPLDPDDDVTESTE